MLNRLPLSECEDKDKDAFKQFFLRGSWDPPPWKKCRLPIPCTWVWVFCKSMITVLYFNIFCIMLWVFNMLRHQRRRLERDRLNTIPLIKCAQVSPLSWGSLFSPPPHTHPCNGNHRWSYLGCFLKQPSTWVCSQDRLRHLQPSAVVLWVWRFF